MTTSWKRTLGIILSTGLFIMPLGAYATVEGEQDTTVSAATDALSDNGPGNSGTELTRYDSLEGAERPASNEEDNPTKAAEDRVITQTEEVAGHDADSPPTDSQPAEARQDVTEGKTEDKSVQTDVAVEKSEPADKAGNVDSTADDGDENEKVNINTATEDELVEALKGIGPSKAREIIKYRDKHGPFKKVDQLKKVKGIGPSTYADIKSQLEL